MNAFLDSLGLFFQDMFTYAIVAVFLETKPGRWACQPPCFPCGKSIMYFCLAW